MIEYHYTVTMTKINKHLIPSFGKDAEKLELSHLAGGIAEWYSHDFLRSTLILTRWLSNATPEYINVYHSYIYNFQNLETKQSQNITYFKNPFICHSWRGKTPIMENRWVVIGGLMEAHDYEKIHEEVLGAIELFHVVTVVVAITWIQTSQFYCIN